MPDTCSSTLHALPCVPPSVGRRGVCRQGWWFAAPFHPKSNWALREAIRAGGFEAAFLNIQGPDFATPSPPQATQP